MQCHDVRGAYCYAVAVRSINEIWVKARVCFGIGWVVWLFCVHWVWRDVLVGFLARLIEGVWGSPSPVPSPLDSCLRRNDVGALPLWIPACAGMTWVRRAYPASIASLARAPFAGAKGADSVVCFEIIAASVGIACDSFLVFVCSFVSQRRRRRQTVGPPGSVWKICPRHRSVVTLASAVASPARRGG